MITDHDWHVIQFLRSELLPFREISQRLKIDEKVVRYQAARGVAPSQRIITRRRQSRVMTKRRALVRKLVNTKVIVQSVHITPKRKIRKTRKCIRQPYSSPGRISRQLALAHGISVHPITVRRDLILMGKRAVKRRKSPRLDKAHRDDRVKFCEWVQANPTKEFMFSDEKNLNSNDSGSQYQWVTPREQVLPIDTDQGAPCVMLWGCCGIGFKYLAVLKKENLTAELYHTKVLEPFIDKCKEYQRTHRQAVFQQDNARPHMKSHDWLTERRVRVLRGWPPLSPDLSPIETLWDYISKRVKERGPWGVDQLAEYAMDEWDKIPQEVVDRHVLSFRARCKKCMLAKGATIKP